MLYAIACLGISQTSAIISPHNVKWLIFLTEKEIVYCAVRN